MRNKFFRKFFPPIRSRFQREQDYLNQSVSERDLERRVREIDQGLFR